MSDRSHDNMGDKKDEQGPRFHDTVGAIWKNVMKKVMKGVCGHSVEITEVEDPSNSLALENPNNHGSKNPKKHGYGSPPKDLSTIEPFCRLSEIVAFRSFLRRTREYNIDYRGLLKEFLDKPFTPITFTDKTNKSREIEELMNLCCEISDHHSVFKTLHEGHNPDRECNCKEQIKDLEHVLKTVTEEVSKNL